MALDFIDAHHHLWIPEQRDPDLGYVWLRDIGAPKPFGDPTPIQRDYEWTEYAAESKAHRLCGSVYVQVDGSIADPLGETAWVQSVFDRTNLAHGIVGLVDLSAETASESLAAQASHRSFRGVRQILSRLDASPALSFASRHHVRNAAWRTHYAQLSNHDLSFDLQLYPEQMPELAEFLADHPGIPVIVDHAGSPHDRSRAGFSRWQEGVRQLAQLSHVSMKLCGFGMFDRNWSATSVRPIVDTLVTAFGSDRLVWGSNLPVESLMNTCDHAIASVLQCLEHLSAAERDAVFYSNAQRIYRLA